MCVASGVEASSASAASGVVASTMTCWRVAASAIRPASAVRRGASQWPSTSSSRIGGGSSPPSSRASSSRCTRCTSSRVPKLRSSSGIGRGALGPVHDDAQVGRDARLAIAAVGRPVERARERAVQVRRDVAVGLGGGLGERVGGDRQHLVRALEPRRAILAPRRAARRSTDVSGRPLASVSKCARARRRGHARRGRGRRDRSSARVREPRLTAAHRTRAAASPRRATPSRRGPRSGRRARRRAVGASPSSDWRSEARSRRVSIAAAAAGSSDGSTPMRRYASRTRRSASTSSPASRRLSVRSRASSLHLDPQGGGARRLASSSAARLVGGVTEPLVGAGSRADRCPAAASSWLRRSSSSSVACLACVLAIALDHQPVRADAARDGGEQRRARRPAAIPRASRATTAATQQHAREAERHRRAARRHRQARRARAQACRTIASNSRSAVAIGPVAVGLVHRDDAVDLAQPRLDAGRARARRRPPARRARSARSEAVARASSAFSSSPSAAGSIGGGVRERGALALELAELLLERVRRARATPRSRRAGVRSPRCARSVSRRSAASAASAAVARRERGALDLRARLLGRAQRLLRVMGLGARDLQRPLARARRARCVALRGEDLDRPARRRVPLAARERRLERGGDRALLVGDRRELALAHDEAALEDGARDAVQVAAQHAVAGAADRRGAVDSPSARRVAWNAVRPLRSQSMRRATPPALRVTIAMRYGPPSHGAKRSRRRTASASRRWSVLEKQPNSAGGDRLVQRALARLVEAGHDVQAARAARR